MAQSETPVDGKRFPHFNPVSHDPVVNAGSKQAHKQAQWSQIDMSEVKGIELRSSTQEERCQTSLVARETSETVLIGAYSE
jgi:hypothetical protein